MTIRKTSPAIGRRCGDARSGSCVRRWPRHDRHILADRGRRGGAGGPRRGGGWRAARGRPRTRIIAARRANIVDLLHDRAYYGVSLGDTVIDVTLETRGPDHIAEIEADLQSAGYRHERVR